MAQITPVDILQTTRFDSVKIIKELQAEIKAYYEWMDTNRAARALRRSSPSTVRVITLLKTLEKEAVSVQAVLAGSGPGGQSEAEAFAVISGILQQSQEARVDAGRKQEAAKIAGELTEEIRKLKDLLDRQIDMIKRGEYLLRWEESKSVQDLYTKLTALLKELREQAAEMQAKTTGLRHDWKDPADIDKQVKPIVRKIRGKITPLRKKIEEVLRASEAEDKGERLLMHFDSGEQQVISQLGETVRKYDEFISVVSDEEVTAVIKEAKLTQADSQNVIENLRKKSQDIRGELRQAYGGLQALERADADAAQHDTRIEDIVQVMESIAKRMLDGKDTEGGIRHVEEKVDALITNIKWAERIALLSESIKIAESLQKEDLEEIKGVQAVSRLELEHHEELNKALQTLQQLWQELKDAIEKTEEIVDEALGHAPQQNQGQSVFSRVFKHR